MGLCRVGVSCRNGAFRSKTFMSQNPQQGELQGMGYAISLGEKFGWSSASVVGDKTAAIASVNKLSATPRAVTQNKILRRIFNRLWWSGTLLHLFWVKSEMMPADALSRLKGTNPTSISRATVDAVSKWGILMSDVRQLAHMGSARV